MLVCRRVTHRRVLVTNQRILVVGQGVKPANVVFLFGLAHADRSHDSPVIDSVILA